MTFLLQVNLHEHNHYDESGKLQVKLEYDNDWKLTRKHIFSYDKLGRLIKWYYVNLNYDISFDENKTEFSTRNYFYNNDGLLIEESEINSNNDLNYKSLIYYDIRHNESERIIIDSKGIKKFRFSYKYDENLCITSIQESFNSSGSYKSKFIFEYDSQGNLISKTEYNKDSNIDKLSIFKYNELSKLIEWSEYDKGKYLKFNLKLFYYEEQLIKECTYNSPYHKTKYSSKYDKDGNIVEKIDYNENNNIDLRDKFKSREGDELEHFDKNIITFYDKYDRLVKEMKHNKFNGKLLYQIEYIYNAEGKLIRIICNKFDDYYLIPRENKETIIFHPSGYPIQKIVEYENGKKDKQTYFYEFKDFEYKYEYILEDSKNQEREVIKFNKNGIKIFHLLIGNVGYNKVSFIKTYDNDGNILEINYIDISNNYSRHFSCEYDTKGNLVKVVNKEDNTILESIDYDSRSNIIARAKYQLKDIYEKEIFKYDNKGNIIEEYVLSKNYSKCRKLRKFLEIENDLYISKSKLVYDGDNKLIKRIFYKQDNKINSVTELKYDINNNIKEWIEFKSEGIINFKIDYFYDSNCNMIKWAEYDDKNNLVEEGTCKYITIYNSDCSIALDASLINYRNCFFRKFIPVPGRDTMNTAPLYFYFDGTISLGDPSFI